MTPFQSSVDTEFNLSFTSSLQVTRRERETSPGHATNQKTTETHYSLIDSLLYLVIRDKKNHFYN